MSLTKKVQSKIKKGHKDARFITLFQVHTYDDSKFPLFSKFTPIFPCTLPLCWNCIPIIPYFKEVPLKMARPCYHILVMIPPPPTLSASDFCVIFFIKAIVVFHNIATRLRSQPWSLQFGPFIITGICGCTVFKFESQHCASLSST